MTVGSGMADTLRQRYDELDDSARQMLLERMSAGLERLGGLVTTLVDYARASVTETPAATPTPVSVPVQTAANRVMREAPSRPVTVHFDEVSVHADALLLVRVLEQLLRNAVTHTPETASVRLTAHRDGDGWVRFTVADSGPGMTAAQLRAAEERFARGGVIDEQAASAWACPSPAASSPPKAPTSHSSPPRKPAQRPCSRSRSPSPPPRSGWPRAAASTAETCCFGARR
jgi:K+-sensing histidine kinase KdpD